MNIRRHGTPNTIRRAAVSFVFFALVLDVLAVGIVVPILPSLITSFLNGDTAKASIVFGAFGTAWWLMQFLFSPFLGALSDSFGRRPVLLISMLGLGLDMVLMALAPGIMWLFFGRVISGITSATFNTTGAYLADVTPASKRTETFGMVGVAFGIGVGIGPTLGGLLGGIHLRLPFWFAASLCLTNAVYGYFVLPESLPKNSRTFFSWRRANPVAALKYLWSHADLPWLGLITFFLNLAFQAIPSILVMYIEYRYKWNEMQVGVTLGLSGFWSVVVLVFILPRLSARVGDRTTLCIGLASGVAGFILYGLASRGSYLLIGILLMGIWGMSSPAIQGMMSKRVTAKEQGRIQGIQSCIIGLTGFLGPSLYTRIFSYFIGNRNPEVAATFSGAPFLFAAGILILSFALTLRVPHHRP